MPRIIREKYFIWLVDHVKHYPEIRKKDWDRLLRKLQQTEFRWILDMDEDRAENGVGLRFRFGWESNYEVRDVDVCLNDRPCSILEMMVALCIKMESVMADERYGDRTGEWFYCMIQSLGLDEMFNGHYDEEYVSTVLDNFMSRVYRMNGKGGLFTVRRCNEDMRNVEIWAQMNRWLIERAG